MRFVVPSVAFAAHSKDVFVFGEELFQLLKFSIA
jgi:hypothetical protein